MVITRQWHVARNRCLCFPWKRSFIHESKSSQRSSGHETHLASAACPIHPIGACRGSDSPAPPGLSLHSCFPRRPWCMPAAWPCWHGSARLASSCDSAGRARFVRPGLAACRKGFAVVTGDVGGWGEDFCDGHVTVELWQQCLMH